MERTQELFEKINSYLNNEMKGNTLKAFEDLLKTDKVFQLEVEKHRLVQQALKDEDTLLFREKLRVIDQELHENDLNASTKKGTRYFWKIAAIFIIFIGLPSLIWFWNMPQEEDLFSTYYVPYPINAPNRGAANGQPELIKIAVDYKHKKYRKTICALENLIKQHPNDAQLKLYLGNSYLNTCLEEKALTLFRSFKENDLYYDDAQWFLALTHLKMNNFKATKTQLHNLTHRPNLYSLKAKKLLHDIIHEKK